MLWCRSIEEVQTADCNMVSLIDESPYSFGVYIHFMKEGAHSGQDCRADWSGPQVCSQGPSKNSVAGREPAGEAEVPNLLTHA